MQKHKIGWVKFTEVRGFSPLGADFLLVAGNSWLMVVNSNPPYKQHIYQADEGVQVAAGHRQLPCFAYAQKNNQPEVFILVYPGFKIIRSLPGIKNAKYLSLDFCDLEILVAMIEHKDEIGINIWNWRTVELITVVSSAIQDPKHCLSVSLVSPVRFIEWDNLRIFAWQLYPSFRKNLASRNFVSFPESLLTPICTAWNTDGECFILDSRATLYSVNFDTGSLQKEANFDCGIKSINAPCLAYHPQGFIIHFDDHIGLIKKKGDDWFMVFKTNCPPIKGLTTVVNNAGKENILGWSQNNELLILKTDNKNTPEMVTISNYGGGFDKLCIIKPEANQFLSYQTGADKIILWNLNSGIKLGEISIPKAGPLVMTCSALRNVILGYPDGFLEILSFGAWARFRLHPTRQPIDDVEFLGIVDAFCVCSRQVGEFYFIKKTAENWDVSAFLQADYEVSSFTVRHNPEVSLFVLPSAPSQFGGKSVRVYDLNNRTFVLHKEVVLDRLYTQMTQSNDNILLVPFGSKYFHVFDEKLEWKDCVLSGNLIARFRLLVGNSIISYGIDGLINTRDGGQLVWLLTHHRTDGGVAILDADASGTVFLAGADNGCFTCYSNRSTNVEPQTFTDFTFLQNEGTTTWLDKWEKSKLEMVFENERGKKEKLLMDLQSLKQTIQNLLNANETCPDDEKLPVSCFEINPKGRQKIADQEKLTRLEIHEFELARIQIQDALSALIIKSTWDLVETPARELCPILPKSGCSVHSYGLMREGSGNRVPWILERKRLIRDFHNLDYLEAWLPRRDKRIPRHGLSRKVSLVENALDSGVKIRLPFNSTSSHLFLSARELPHSELQVNTQFQAEDVIVITDGVIREMMIWFNNEFSAVRNEKERELRSLSDRRERLRQVAEELEELDGAIDVWQENLVSSTWSATENPETFLRVLDSELNEPPYLTEEELEKQRTAALEEAIRLEKLRADDFRERALNAMMDGVLNKKWQEEIKKDVVKPSFMDEKLPENWSEDENRRAKIYQDAVEKLQTERERYKKLLIAEFKQLAASAQETGARFGEKLKQLNGLKLRIESAICQEQLNILRMRMEIMQKIALSRKEEKLTCSISEGEHKLETLVDEAAKLQDAISEARAFLESLQTRDKNMEKNFKKDFPEYSSIICELLNKLSKKRPKMLGSNNAALLNELGRYAVQTEDRTHRLPMPQEFIEYLKGLDQLDGAVNTPASVNENSWENLCRLRRAKIDSELKIRSVSIDLLETEQTAIQWQKMIKSCRETIYRKQAELEGLLNDRRMNELDCSVQIVVPQRIVEVPTTGKMDDFSGAVLLSRALIDDVNEAIQNAGEQKVRAMEKACEFRKGIIYKEWEHQKLRLRVEDLKAQLDALEHVHVTKELQEILNARARGDYIEKGFGNLEKEIQAVNVRFQRAEASLMQTIDDYERKITGLDQQNNDLDLRIVALNKVLGKRTLLRDISAEQSAEKDTKLRMKNITRRGRLAARTQELAAELAALQAERDLLCLRAYPTLIPN